jgi:signal transduction histidine kinase
MSILLFQVVRELYMNVVKHSQAHQVVTHIRREGDRLLVQVEDDGIGFDASSIDKHVTFGFFSIRERLKYLGGSLEIDTTPGKGTRIAISSPLALAEKAAEKETQRR